MKSIYYLSLSFLFLLLCFKSRASNTLGADLQVFATSTPKHYTVRLTVYNDCSGMPLCSGSCDSSTCTQSISIKGVNGIYAGTDYGSVSLNFIRIEESRLHLCPGANTICDNLGCKTAGTLSPGVEKYIFEAIVNLDSWVVPLACDVVSISWEQCCRNAAITTGSANENFYIEAVINKNISNSTPMFIYDPFFVLCSGTTLSYNMGGWDLDGDSLSYSFAPSLQGPNQSVDYLPPYSYYAPLPWSGPINGTFPAGIRCDARTGDIMFSPNNGSGGTLAGVTAVQVTEWRKINGVSTIISKTSRDFQTWLISCYLNNAPRFKTSGTSNPNFPIYNWNACEGSTLCFDITAIDADTIDSTYLRFDSLLVKMGATITPKYSTRQREDAYTFCWTPPVGSARDVPYYLFPIATDSKCPYMGKAQRAFAIKVSGSGNIAIQKNIQCDYAMLSHSGTLQQGTTRQWEVSLTPGVYDSLNLLTTSYPTVINHFKKAGRYPFRLNLTDACATRILYDTIVIKNAVDLPDRVLSCVKNQSLILQSQEPVTAPVSYKWYIFPDTTVVIGTLPQLYITASNTTYLLHVTDTSGCTYHGYTDIVLSTPVAQFSVNDDKQCLVGNQFIFHNQSVDSNGYTLSYTWSISDTSQSFINDSLTKSFDSSGTYPVKLKAASSAGCADSLETVVSVFPMPKAAFQINDSIQCRNGNQFIFTNNSTIVSNSLTYSWDFGNSMVSSNTNPNVSYQQGGNYFVKLIAISDHGCQDSLGKKVVVNVNPVVNFTINDDGQCFNGHLFVYTSQSTIASGVMSQRWYLGDGNTASLPSPKYNYRYLNPGVYFVTLRAISDKGCIDSLRKRITVNPSPLASFVVNDPDQCTGDLFGFTNTSTISNGALTSEWSTGDNQSFTHQDILHAYSNPGNYVVKLTVTSDSLCSDITMQTVTVYDRPAKPIISGSSVVVEHTTETYTVPFDSGSTWQWLIAGDSSHSISGNSATIHWGDHDTGYIIVRETNANGCYGDTGYTVIMIQLSTGLKELAVLNGIQWYPVPAKDVVYFTSSNTRIDHISLYNMEGKELMDFSQEDIAKRELPLKNISTGVYFLKLESKGNRVTRKISIIK